ncbi:MAG: hypothetical protein PGN13_11580 [Patulibacter minatonensis]
MGRRTLRPGSAVLAGPCPGHPQPNTTGATRTEYHRALYSGADYPDETPWNLDANTPSQSNGRRNKADKALTGTVRGQLEAPPSGPAVGLRSNNWYWPRFEQRIRNYCVLADPICNRSGTNAGEHLNDFDNARPRRDLQIFAVRTLREDDPRWAGNTRRQGYPTYFDWSADAYMVP